MITSGGSVSTLAGLPGSWGNADGTNRAARFFQPQGISLDGLGNIFVMDAGNHALRMLSPSGTNWIVTTVAGQSGVGGSADGSGSSAQFYYPAGLDFNSTGLVAVADSGNSTIRVALPPVAQFDGITFAGNGSIQLFMSGRANTNYTLLTTTNWSNWDVLTVLPSGGGSFQYTDPSAATNRARFYRLRLGP
jgi:hypothetical protein